MKKQGERLGGYNRAFVLKCDYADGNEDREAFLVVYRDKAPGTKRISIEYSTDIDSIMPLLRKLFKDGYHITGKKPADIPIVGSIKGYSDLPAGIYMKITSGLLGV